MEKTMLLSFRIKYLLFSIPVWMWVVTPSVTNASTEGKKMVSSHDIKNSVLAVPEQRYFENTDGSFRDLVDALSKNARSETAFRGVAINAPTSIALKQHATLPILMAIQQTGLRGWEVGIADNCLLVATDLNRRTVSFGGVIRDPPNKIPIPRSELPLDPKPTGTNATSISSGVDRIDAREILSLPWEPGRYSFTVVVFDWRSNTVDVELTDGKTVPAATTPPLKLNPAAGTNHGLPTFLANATTLPPAEKNLPSAAFQVALASAPGPRLKVTGKFSIVADAFHLPVASYKVKEVDGKEKTVAATVPVTLLVFGKDDSRLVRGNWVLPVYADQPIKAGERVEGYFSIDALAEDKFPLAAGDYVAYLVIEGRMVGPVAFSSALAVK